MTKIEYIKSLVATGLTSKEISAKTKIWAAENEPQEVKTDDTQNTDATVVSTTNEASNGASSDGASDYQSVAKPAETYSPGDGNDYKYEVDDNGNPTYYQKAEGTDEWIASSDGSTDQFSIAGKFKHVETNEDNLKATEDLLDKTRQDLNARIEDIANTELNDDGTSVEDTDEARKKLIEDNPILQASEEQTKAVNEKIKAINLEIEKGELSEEEIATKKAEIKEIEYSITPLGIAAKGAERLQELIAVTKDQHDDIDYEISLLKPTKRFKPTWDKGTHTAPNPEYVRLEDAAKVSLSQEGIEPPDIPADAKLNPDGSLIYGPYSAAYNEELKVYNEKTTLKIQEKYREELESKAQDNNLEDLIDETDQGLFERAKDAIIDDPLDTFFTFYSAISQGPAAALVQLEGFKMGQSIMTGDDEKGILGKTFISKSEFHQQNEAFKKLIALDLNPKLKKASNVSKKSPIILENIQKAQEALANGNYQTQEEVEDANKLLLKLQNQAKSVFGVYESSTIKIREDLIPKMETIEDLRMLDYNFNTFPIFATNAVNATIEGVQSISELGYRVMDMPNAAFEQMEKWTGKPAPPGSTLVSAMLGTMLGGPLGAVNAFYPDAVEEGKDYLWDIIDNYQNELMSDMPPSKSLGDLEDMGDWGRYTAVMLGSQLPNTAVMFGTGGFALPLLTAQAGGGAFLEMESDMKMSREANTAWKENEPEDKDSEAYRQWKENEPVVLDYSPAQMYSVAMGKMALEYATEKISLGLIKNAGTVFSANKIASKGFIENVAGLLTPNALKAGFYGLAGIAGEGLGEGTVEFGGNILDRVILGKEGDLFEGVPDAVFQGVVMAGGVYKAPALFRNVMDIVQTADTAGVLANNQFKIEKLQKQMLDNPNMSIENKEKLKLRIASLVKKSSDFVNKDLDRYSTMDPADIRSLSKIELQKFKLQNELKSVANDTGIVTGKDELLAAIQSQIVELDVQKAKILAPQQALEKKYPSNRPILSNRTDMVLAPKSMQNNQGDAKAENDAAGFEVKPRDPVKKEIYSTEMDSVSSDTTDKVTAEVTTLKDGSRKVTLKNSDGDTVSVEKISKNSDISNEAFIKATISAEGAGPATLNETIEGAENLINKRSLATRKGETYTPNISEKAKKIKDSYGKIDTLAENDSFNPDKITRLTERQKNKILENAGGTIESTLNRLWKPSSLLTKAEFRNSLKTEYLKAYLEYTSKKDANNQGVGRQVSNLFNLRANKVASDNIKKGNTVSADSEKAQQVADTTETKEFDEAESIENQQREKVYSSQVDVVSDIISPETKARIKDQAAKEILLLANKGKTALEIASELKEESKNNWFREIKQDIGTFASKKYKDFVNSLDSTFIKSLAVSDIKRRFGKLFNIKQIGTTETKQLSKSGKISNFKKQVFSVPRVTEQSLQKFKDYFLGSEKRQQSLYSILAADMALESLQELINDSDFMQKLADSLDVDVATALEFMEIIEAKLDNRTKENKSLDVVDTRSIDEAINDTITEENVDTIKPDALTKIITKLDSFSKPDGTLKMDFGLTALTKLVSTGLKTLKAFKQANISFAKALSNFVKYLKKGIKDLNSNLSTKQNTQLTEIMALDGINSTGSANVTTYLRDKMGIDVGDITATKDNRVARQLSILKSIIDGKIPFKILKLLNLQNFGAERIRDKNGDVFYILTNGAKMPGVFKGTSKKTGKKIFDPPTAQEVENFAGKGIKLQAALGSLYYGKADPAYLAMEKAGLVNDKLYPDQFVGVTRIKIPPGKKLTTLDKYKNKAQEEINQKALADFVNILDIGVQNGTIPLNDAALLISQAYQGTTSLIKISAPFVGVSDVFIKAPKGTKQAGRSTDYIEEHSPPASAIGAAIIFGLATNTTKKIMKGVKANFIQVQLSNHSDVILDNAGLAAKLADGTNILTPNAGFLRLAEAGIITKNPLAINLNTIIDLKTGLDIATVMGFPLEGEFKTDPSSVIKQYKLMLEQARNPESKISRFVKRLNAYVYNLGKSVIGAGLKNVGIFGTDVIDTKMSIDKQVEVLNNYDKTLDRARSFDAPRKGISVFDFDDTLAKTKEKVIVNKADGTTIEISAAEFAEQGQTLEDNGATFDFTNFEKVINAEKGPLADLALKRQSKFGSKDIFVLTARPQIAASGIKKFLDGIGLNIPLENITGLENGSPQAKANWVVSKTAEGYNDFYFADDAIGNVKAVKDILDQVDVKSKVQVAKTDMAEAFDTIMNDIIEGATGIEAYKEYSAARAKTVGANKGKYTFLTTPSAEDFLGLIYKLLGKGKIGDAQMAFFKTNIIDPYNRAEAALTRAKTTAANDFKALKNKLKTLPKSLSKLTGIGGFTFGQAVRVAIWTRQGMAVPGMSKRDIKELNDFVSNNAELDVFADELIKLQKGKPYPKPTESWLAGTIVSDIINDINKTNRKEYLQQWQANIDVIFSDKNMNKLEAAYGPRYVEALRDQIRRMKSGSNRPIGGSRIVNNLLDWLNNSVGAIMFLNTRSAVLQTISAVNFINWGDNNIYKAGLAFANQKQYWKDFMTLFNSPYLVDRRDGLKINVSESEIADAVSESTNKPKAFLNLLLSKGFVLTRFADSFAIAVGGSTFYRNRVEALIKQGMTKQAAEAQAFEDFYAIAEESQQSSNPSRISQQQASSAGRVILAFANTPMQYARIIKRSTQDLINGRGDWKSNMSKIVYYAAIQNVMFNALQSALFALAFDDEEEETEEARQKKIDNKKGRIANGMIDSLVRGLGIQGAAVVALKDAIMTIARENNKDGSPDFAKAIYDMFGFSPPLDSKLRKLKSAANTLSWDQERIQEEGFSLNNPAYLAAAQVVSALTNVPLDRAIQKMNNLRAIFSNSSENWQKVALTLGWSTWDLDLPYFGVEDKEIQTPQTILRDKVLKMKKDTSGAEQKQMLLDLGLTKQEIKALKYEEVRIKKIIELQNKNKK